MLKEKFRMYNPNGLNTEETEEIPVPLEEYQTAVKAVFDLTKKYTEILSSTVLIDQLERTIEIRLKLGK